MKSKRHKKSQKILQYYWYKHGIKAPFKVMVDGTFCNAALEAKVKIAEQIPKYLDAETKLITTQCIILEVEKLCNISKKFLGPYLIVKQYEVCECGHEGKPKPAAECIKSLLESNNPKKLVVASQDQDLKQYIRSSVEGTPLLSLYWSSPFLEKPRAMKHGLEHSTLSFFEAETLEKLKQQHLPKEEEEVEKPLGKKRKWRRQKNPSSCKKNKKDDSVPHVATQEKSRSRKRKKH